MFTYPFNGPSEDDARKPAIPAFLETEPDRFKPLEKCSRSKIEAQIMSRNMQAQALFDEADKLQRYLDGEIDIQR